MQLPFASKFQTQICLFRIIGGRLTFVSRFPRMDGINPCTDKFAAFRGTLLAAMDRCRPRIERHSALEASATIHDERCDGIWETQTWGIEIWTWIPTHCT